MCISWVIEVEVLGLCAFAVFAATHNVENQL